jgi:hypothetical protein
MCCWEFYNYRRALDPPAHGTFKRGVPVERPDDQAADEPGEDHQVA